MTVAKTLLTASVLLAAACSSPAERVARRLDALFTAAYPDPEAPGTAVLVVHGEEVLFEKSYGMADLCTHLPVTSQTQFCLASISKQFAAVAALQMVHDGLVGLHEPLSGLFPEFEAPFWHRITLHHLLSHTSGIPDARPHDDPQFVYRSTDVASCRYMIRLDRLDSEPGARYAYCNPTYQLIYQLVERRAGMPFEHYMQRRVFDPAGMGEARYFEEGRTFPHPSHAYTRTPDGWAEQDYGETPFFASKADGGLYASVRDLWAWERALRQGRVLDSQSTRLAFTAHVTVPPDAEYGANDHTGYGYGWFVQQRPGWPTCLYHTGDNGGYWNYMARIPERGLFVVFLANCDEIDRLRMADAVYTILREEGYL